MTFLPAAVIAFTLTGVVPVSSEDKTSVVLELYEQQNDLMIELLLNEGCSFPPNSKTEDYYPIQMASSSMYKRSCFLC